MGFIEQVTGQNQTSLKECQESLQCQEANRNREDKEEQRPVGSERGRDVTCLFGHSPLPQFPAPCPMIISTALAYISVHPGSWNSLVMPFPEVLHDSG